MEDEEKLTYEEEKKQLIAQEKKSKAQIEREQYRDQVNSLPEISPDEIKLKEVKNMFFGLQGSGKTQCAIRLIKRAGLRTLVYTPHKHDFKNEPDIFFFYNYKDFYDDFEDFIKIAVQLGKRGEIDLIFVDEFDTLYKAGKTKTETFVDFTANHRHYKLGAEFLSRRPQDIDPAVVESCETLIGFAIMGDNVKLKLNRLFKDYGNFCQALEKEEHNAVVLEVGKFPRLMRRIN